MQKRNNFWKLFKFTGLFFVLCFYFGVYVFPAQAGELNEEGDTYININKDTTWHSGDNLNFNKTIYVNPGATLTIEPGSSVILEKDINENETSLNILGGRLIASGTQKNPIRIAASQDNHFYLINFRNDRWDGYPEAQPSFLRYVEIFGGGAAYDNGGAEQTLNNLFMIPAALAYFDDGTPAVYFESGRAHMENCVFRDNAYADIGIEFDGYAEEENSRENYLEVVNSNFEKNGDAMAIKVKLWCNAEMDCDKNFIFKNNWYGDPVGPFIDHPWFTPNEGKRVSGFIWINTWRRSNLIADPVVIIPGIMGSAKLLGVWKLDPILHIYDNLVESLDENGYEKGKNLFEFPYEWRNGNEITAGDLKSKIGDIIAETKISKVDVVAHSMGGLVARAYIEGNNYDNNIDQLITLGTPHKGSPEAYLKWEAGEGFFTWGDRFAKFVFTNEASHYGKNLKDYIQSKVLSVKDLLPDYPYLSRDGVMQDYSDDYPRNGFLEGLNEQTNLEKLGAVDFTNIIGNTKRTISEIKIVDSNVSGKWEDGMPENFYDGSTDQGLKYGSGDETVPKYSAESIASDDLIKMNSTHQDLPTKAQCEVIEKLTNKENCVYTDAVHLSLSTLFVSVYSPIDIQVIAPPDANGVRKRVGKDFDHPGEILNEIPGAYYTGYDGVDSEFLTIPDPEDGEYTIITEGTGTGEYKIEAVKISESETTGETAESVKTIAGTAVPGISEENTIEIAGAGIVGADENSEPEPVTIDSIISEVNGYAINAKDKKFILNKLDEIRKLPEDNKKQNIKQINKKIDDLIKEINKNNKFQIDQPTKDLLIESLNFIKLKI